MQHLPTAVGKRGRIVTHFVLLLLFYALALPGLIRHFTAKGRP